MVSASLNIQYTKLQLQHSATALFIMELPYKISHTKSFRHCECMNKTELSKHMWNLNDQGLGNNLLWKIHKKVSPYQCGSKCCDICLSEKVSTICGDPDTLLNKRTKLIPSVATETYFCWPTLRNNWHGVVFNYFPQFFYRIISQLYKTKNKASIFVLQFFVRDLRQAVTSHFHY